MRQAKTVDERRKLINEFYDLILKEYDPKTNTINNIDLFVYNKNINAIIYVADASKEDTQQHSAQNEQSAMAVLSLYTILRNADQPETENTKELKKSKRRKKTQKTKNTKELKLKPVKEGTKGQKTFSNIALLYYENSVIGKVKLVLGKKKIGNYKYSGELVQYCIKAIEKV